MTEKELMVELENMVMNYDDDILFCLQEYNDIMSISHIAKYFVEAFEKRVLTLTEELEENENV